MADALSRLRVNAISQVFVQPTWLTEIREALESDPEASAARVLLREGTTMWTENEGLLYFQGRVYIPRLDTMRKSLIEEAHNVPTAGHPGVHRTVARLLSHYFWSMLKQDVRSYIRRFVKSASVQRPVVSALGDCFSRCQCLNGHGSS